ncbi:MAG: hypothetical protein Q9207_004454 [Kuettlingeria erythrocarpa]
MRTVSASVLLALGLAVQQAAATGWTDAETFTNPYNTNNECTDKQTQGLPFDDHPTGDLGFYGDLNWANTKCTNGLSKRTFGHDGEESHSGGSKDFAGGKCASGTASKDVNSSPSFSCGPKQKGMSIDTIHISSSEDTEVELYYTYENGDICKQPASCSKSGSVIKNSQCGDAKGVVVKLPDTDTKSSCEVGIHSVGFNCGPASSKPPVPSSTPIISTPIESKPYPIPTANTTSVFVPTGTAPVTNPVTTPVTTAETTAGTTAETIPISSTDTFTSSLTLPSITVPQNTSILVSSVPVISTPETTPIASTTENSPETAATTPGSTVPIVTTQVVYTTLTTCPVTNTVTSGTSTSLETTSTISTVLITSTSTVCTQCVPPPASTPETSTVPEVPASTASVSEVPTSVPEIATTVPEIPTTVPGVPAVTTPESSSTANSPETPISSVPVPTTSAPAPVPTTTQAVVTTEVVYVTTTTCPVTTTKIEGTTTSVETISTVSTITSTSVSTICTQCIPPAPPATGTPPPLETGTPSPPPPASGIPSSSPPVITPVPSTDNSPVGESSVPIIPPSSPATLVASPPAPCPTVLPKCMKTWITLTTCKDNSDSNCYCQNADFTQSVQDCVSAWASSGTDVQGALSYLAGICAPHVSQNPGIITHVPKTITLVPTPATPAQTSGPAAAPPASSAPETLIPGVTSAPAVPAGSPEATPGALGSSPVGASPAVPAVPAGSPEATPGALGSSPVGTSPAVPAGSAPATPGSPGSSPVGGTYVPGAPGSSPVTAAAPPPAAQPVTTLSLSQTVTYACPVSQLADGQPQAPASCSSLLSTQVVVPQVGFTTVPSAPGETSSPSVGLAAGSPAPVPATPTAGPGANSPVGATTFGTVVGSASAVGSVRPPGSTGAIPFTGAASGVKATTGFGVLAGVVGMLLLA